MTNRLMNEARTQFYKNFIDENCTNQKNLFNAVDKLLNKSEKRSVFPPSIDKQKYADQMGNYFVSKIQAIHTKLDIAALSLPVDSVDNTPETSIHLDKFTALTEEEVLKLVEGTAKKSCNLDPMPTPLVIDCIDVLLPAITTIINLSLESGMFPDVWKNALIHPLLKKPGIDRLFKNYRPISNLQYVSKLTEKAVFNQTDMHMTVNSIYPQFQSSYRRFHSTETALLKVTNDILLKMNSQHVTLLVTLDLSAAFDTVNHGILINCLDKVVGIQGKALDWFTSYLSNRSQQVYLDGILSKQYELDSGVPQGSCLGPLLFIIYVSRLFRVIEDQLPDAHGYADDTQLYLSFKPSSAMSQQNAVLAMEKCIEKIRQWMVRDRLLMNDDKTEFMLIGTHQQLSKLQPLVIAVNNFTIYPQPTIKNLGCWLDSQLKMSTHITNVCKACFFHLHNIRRIKKFLSRDSLLVLLHAFITSKLDYCNSLLYGAPKKQISKLQRVQNAAARLVMDVGKYSHITPVLRDLHWLPVEARIHFKVLLLAFKAIHGLAPTYIQDLIKVKSRSSYSLRSNSGILLERPKGKMLVTLGDRSFYAAAPHLWNSLPANIRTIRTCEVFKKLLKTYLFKQFLM